MKVTNLDPRALCGETVTKTLVELQFYRSKMLGKNRMRSEIQAYPNVLQYG